MVQILGSVGEASGGQKQRLSIAVAFLKKTAYPDL